MRLHEFIASHMEAILVDWEAFAATLLPGSDRGILRDHAEQILRAVVADLQTSQTREQQFVKSQGRALRLAEAPQTAAETHAILRARSGLDVRQLAAEYRALRSSVLRLRIDADEPARTDLDDMIRFNEAIDQALAESVDYFSTQTEQARNLLLGMLGHDMRAPLQAIQMTASYLASINAGEPISSAASKLIRSGQRMESLLDDLVDFNRVLLGIGLRIDPKPVTLSELFGESVAQLRAANPHRNLEFVVTGDTRGQWDGKRLQQVLDNLVVNAFIHGSPDEPVRVAVQGKEDEVHLSVTNAGAPIAPEALHTIFDPLTRVVGGQDGGEHLGLGLFIAREVTNAHGGTIEVQSDERGTVFSIRLPRRSQERWRKPSP